MPPRNRLMRRWLARGMAGLYLAAAGWCLLWRVVGDPVTSSWAYLFTWDMFPTPYTTSWQRLAIGQTRGGRFVQVHPSPGQRYRGGVNRAWTRVDLERGGRYFADVCDRTAQLANQAAPADPILQVWLIEQTWPETQNVDADLFEAWQGRPRPVHRAWRLVARWDVIPPASSPSPAEPAR